MLNSRPRLCSIVTLPNHQQSGPQCGDLPPYKWHYQWVSGVVFSLSMELWAPAFFTGRGPACTPPWFWASHFDPWSSCLYIGPQDLDPMSEWTNPVAKPTKPDVYQRCEFKTTATKICENQRLLFLSNQKSGNFINFHLPTKCLMEVFPRCDIAHFLTSLQTSLLWTLLETLKQRVWKDTASHQVILTE